MGSPTVREFEAKQKSNPNGKSITFHSEYFAKPDAGQDLKITFLGTAGFIFEARDRTIVADPYLNRANLKSVARNLPLDPLDRDSKAFSDEKRIDVADYIDAVDDVVIGHSHYDHILDAPWLVMQKDARLIGSPTSVWIAKAAWRKFGWEPSLDNFFITEGNHDIPCGEAGDMVRANPSRHAPQVDGVLNPLLSGVVKLARRRKLLTMNDLPRLVESTLHLRW